MISYQLGAVMAVTRWWRLLAASQGRSPCLHTSAGSAGKERAKSEQATLDFEDTRAAYRSMSFSELFRHYVVFKTFTYKSLVDNNKAVSLLPYTKHPFQIFCGVVSVAQCTTTLYE